VLDKTGSLPVSFQWKSSILSYRIVSYRARWAWNGGFDGVLYNLWPLCGYGVVMV